MSQNRSAAKITSSCWVALCSTLGGKESSWAEGFSLTSLLKLESLSCYLNSRGMTLRRPAAHLRKTPAWRRSGDESYWERLLPEDVLTPAAHPPRAPRPQSAIEGGQLDGWLEQLQGMQSNLLTTAARDQVPVFNDRTTSMPALNKEPNARAWRQLGIPSFSGGSSSCGSSSLGGSLLGSQESLQTGFFPPPECRGSCEQVHVLQLPRKEQPQLSFLAPVKTGWLPIQRRVMMLDDACNHSVGQVKQAALHWPSY